MWRAADSRTSLVVALAAALALAPMTSCSGGSQPTPTEAVVRSAGCGGAAKAVATGETKLTISSGGTTRWYYRHVPPAHDGVHPVPLVVDLHGYEEGAQVHVMMSGLGPFGDRHGFMTVTPQGSGRVPNWDPTATSADMRFIGQLLDEVEATTCVDTRRVFFAGLSDGGMMASAVACVYSSRVAAIAPVAWVVAPDPCPLARPVPVVAIQGTADPFIAYTGGLGPKVADLPSPDGSGKTLGQEGLLSQVPKTPSIPDVMASWARRDGCAATPANRSVAIDVTLVTFPSCPRGVDVELYRIDGGGHAWPGSAFSASIAQVVGRTTMSISANEVIWSFFQAHPLAGSRQM